MTPREEREKRYWAEIRARPPGAPMRTEGVTYTGEEARREASKIFGFGMHDDTHMFRISAATAGQPTMYYDSWDKDGKHLQRKRKW